MRIVSCALRVEITSERRDRYEYTSNRDMFNPPYSDSDAYNDFDINMMYSGSSSVSSGSSCGISYLFRPKTV